MSFKVTPKVQLMYKLFLLENVRDALNKELDNFIKEAYEGVHGFLNSPFPTSAFMVLSESLDARCQAIDKLSTFLKDPKFTPQVDINATETFLIQPVKEKKVFKFGPMLQNMFMASSKVVQVLGDTLHLKNYKHFVIPQNSEVQKEGVVCSSSSHNDSEQDTEILKEKEQDSAFVSSPQVLLPPSLSDISKTNTHKPLLPPIPAIPPTTSYDEPIKRITGIKWALEDIQMQHQKQTSSQLLHFLKVKAKNTGALDVTVMEWTNGFLGLPKPPSPSNNYRKKTYKFKQDAATWPSSLLSNTENHAPLFKLKQVESSGSLTYTCVVATKTELWDLGDIVTDLDTSESSSVTSEENIPGQIIPSGETMQWTDNVEKDTTTTRMSKVITFTEFQNKRFEEIEVVVSHIVNPGSFFIQHADASEKLQALVTDTWKESASYAEQNCIPDIGTKVMGWFPQQLQWCRSQVTKICGIRKDNNQNSAKEMSISVEVRRLDYGDTFCVSLSNLKEMTPDMAVLPLQAVHVSLAHVSPVNGRDWTEEAVGWFREMLHSRTLFARLYPEGNRFTVELFLEKGNIGAMRRGASLSLRLTQNGHAKHRQLKNGVGTARLKMKKKDLEWEKYLISCYTQSNLHRGVL